MVGEQNHNALLHVMQALRAEDLDNEGEAEYSMTGARGLLASAHSAGVGRSSRSIAASQGFGPSSATSRPSDLASVSSEAHSTVPSLAPAASLAATKRSNSLSCCYQPACMALLVQPLD